MKTQGHNRIISKSELRRYKIMNKKPPEIISWKGMKLVRISDVDGLDKWLFGQTLPLVEDNKTPTDWAYFWDYERFIKGLPIID